MSETNTANGCLSRRRAALIYLAALALGAALYTAGALGNPPGFYLDESSIAYNAHLIATTGRDEHGESFPLFFRAFGEYKNPVYIYLLAAVFKVTGPSITASRLLSAVAVVAAALGLGLLATRLTRRRDVGLLSALMALLTPWLFQLGSVALEVSLYPLAAVLFLLAVHRAAAKACWSNVDAGAIAATLALLTYTYSVGRLLAPLLALGLLLFLRRVRFSSVLRAWLLYALALVPLGVFHWRHPGALSARFWFITYITPRSTTGEIAREFVKSYLGNLNPWWMLFKGTPEAPPVSVEGFPPVLAATFLLAVASVLIVVRRRSGDAWWRFVLYGLAVSVVPASLTKEYLHPLRLAAFPVFLLVLAVPALAWLVEENAVRRSRRIVLGLLAALVLVEGALFQWHYHADGHSTKKLRDFDADYAAKILPAALAHPARPIHLADTQPIPGYVHAYWYATLAGIPPGTFKLLPPDTPAPEGALVITTEDSCPRCRKLYEREPYIVYVAEGPPRSPAPLPTKDFRAEIRVSDTHTRARVREALTVRAVVRNAGSVPWPARERMGAPFQLSLGNHWLDTAGREVVHDDGRAPLLRDLQPGEEMEFEFVVNAPKTPGDYLLELDMLQEGVTWFALRGSTTVRLPVRVEASWFD